MNSLTLSLAQYYFAISFIYLWQFSIFFLSFSLGNKCSFYVSGGGNGTEVAMPVTFAVAVAVTVVVAMALEVAVAAVVLR